MVAFGICLGAMVWSLLALMGLNIIFEKMAWLKQGLLVAGGLYLCWLGYQMLRSAFSKGEQSIKQIVLPQSPYLFFMKGLLTNLSNPKAVIYFGSVFSLFLANPLFDQHHSLLFFIIAIETLLWFLVVAFVFSLPTFRTAYQNFAKWIDGISGGIFTLLCRRLGYRMNQAHFSQAIRLRMLNISFGVKSSSFSHGSLDSF